MADWGVPNWRDPSAYPKSSDLTTLEWWWQFLRRRADYRQAWEGARPEHDDGHSRMAPDVDAARVQFHLSRLLDPQLDFDDWRLMQARYPHSYGREPRYSPVLDDPDHVLFKETVRWNNKVEKLRLDANKYEVIFDLQRPLQPQIEHAEALLREAQRDRIGREVRGGHKGLWPEYLQVLDARDAGATYLEIAEALRPGGQKEPFWARDRYQAACQLRDNFPI